jgi:hypothetical protein
MEHKGARRLADRPNLRFRLHTSNLITVCANFLLCRCAILMACCARLYQSLLLSVRYVLMHRCTLWLCKSNLLHALQICDSTVCFLVSVLRTGVVSPIISHRDSLLGTGHHDTGQHALSWSSMTMHSRSKLEPMPMMAQDVGTCICMMGSSHITVAANQITLGTSARLAPTRCPAFAGRPLQL